MCFLVYIWQLVTKSQSMEITGHYKNVCLADNKTWQNKTLNINAKYSKGKGKAKKVQAAEEI